MVAVGKNFELILVPAIAIHVTNMWLKFREDRSSSFGENYNAARKNLVLRKRRLKFFSMKNRKKIVLTANQQCRHHTESLLL